jgi:hypothetical protein
MVSITVPDVHTYNSQQLTQVLQHEFLVESLPLTQNYMAMLFPNNIEKKVKMAT